MRNIHGPRRPSSYSLALMDTNSLLDCLTLALTPASGEVTSASTDWGSMPYNPTIHRACIFRIPSLESWNVSPPDWGIRSHPPRDSPCLPEGNHALRSCTKPIDQGKYAKAPMPPHFHIPPWTLICRLTQPESHPPLSYQDRWPQRQQIGPPMP